MAGYREFQTGEVLTSANVNDFLMDQSVMTFADATARDAALTGVLREGLVAYNLDTSALEKYDGSAWGPVADLTNLDADNLTSGTVAAARLPVDALTKGIGSNVVQTVVTSSFTTMSATFVDVTGLTVTITPTSATSKVLVLCSLAYSGSGSNPRARTVGGNLATSWTDTALVRITSSSQFNMNENLVNAAWMVVDNPGSVSAQTYKVQAIGDANGFFMNRTPGGGYIGGASSIIAIEVAA